MCCTYKDLFRLFNLSKALNVSYPCPKPTTTTELQKLQGQRHWCVSRHTAHFVKVHLQHSSRNGNSKRLGSVAPRWLAPRHLGRIHPFW